MIIYIEKDDVREAVKISVNYALISNVFHCVNVKRFKHQFTDSMQGLDHVEFYFSMLIYIASSKN